MPSYTPVPNTDIICRTNDDGSKSFIPPDPDNVDYQAYLASKETKAKPKPKVAVAVKPKASPKAKPKKAKKK
jgi:hypothetical protein